MSHDLHCYCTIKYHVAVTFLSCALCIRVECVSIADTPDYFILTWTGLNTRVLLNTIWRPCEDARGTDARGNSLSNLLCEERHTLHWLSRPPHLSADLPAILHTAAECRRRRYLLVVDCYRHSHDNSQEVVLSQAYVV